MKAVSTYRFFKTLLCLCFIALMFAGLNISVVSMGLLYNVNSFDITVQRALAEDFGYYEGFNWAIGFASYAIVLLLIELYFVKPPLLFKRVNIIICIIFIVMQLFIRADIIASQQVRNEPLYSYDINAKLPPSNEFFIANRAYFKEIVKAQQLSLIFATLFAFVALLDRFPPAFMLKKERL